MSETFGAFYLVLVVLGIVLTILWVLLPFAVFSMRETLRQMLAEQKLSNDLLQRAQDTPPRN